MTGAFARIVTMAEMHGRDLVRHRHQLTVQQLEELHRLRSYWR